MLRKHRHPDALELSLAHYLDLRIQELENQAQQELANRHRGEVRSDVGRMVSWLLLLVGYATILGFASQTILLGSMLDPKALARNAAAVLTGIGKANSFVPEPLRGLLLSAISTVVLLTLRTASYSVRADIGGALYVGVTVLALLAFSAAVSAGLWSALVALPGLVAVGFLIHEFNMMLERLRRSDASGEAGGAPPRGAPPPLGQIQGAIESLLHAIAPGRRMPIAVVFVGLPLLCLIIAVAGNFAPLYWPTRLSYVAFIVWCVWAFGVTPEEVRIPLWSIVGWATLFLYQLGATAVTIVFAPAVVIVLLANLALVTLRRQRARQPL